MKKITKIALMGLMLNSMILISCSGPNKAEIQKDIDRDLTYVLGREDFKPNIYHDEFLLAQARAFFVIGEDSCTLPLKWSTNSQHVQLKYVAKSDKGEGLFGYEFTYSDYYTGKVISFPEVDTDVFFNVEVTYKGITVQREYVAVLKAPLV